MRNYGGLRKKIPYTFWAMVIGTLAITGVGVPLTHFGFAGFLSKDAVIESAWAGTNAGFPFGLLVVAALLTSFYSWRLMLMTFLGSLKRIARLIHMSKKAYGDVDTVRNSWNRCDFVWDDLVFKFFWKRLSSCEIFWNGKRI